MYIVSLDRGNCILLSWFTLWHCH